MAGLEILQGSCDVSPAGRWRTAGVGMVMGRAHSAGFDVASLRGLPVLAAPLKIDKPRITVQNQQVTRHPSRLPSVGLDRVAAAFASNPCAVARVRSCMQVHPSWRICTWITRSLLLSGMKSLPWFAALGGCQGASVLWAALGALPAAHPCRRGVMCAGRDQFERRTDADFPMVARAGGTTARVGGSAGLFRLFVTAV